MIIGFVVKVFVDIFMFFSCDFLGVMNIVMLVDFKVLLSGFEMGDMVMWLVLLEWKVLMVGLMKEGFG